MSLDDVAFIRALAIRIRAAHGESDLVNLDAAGIYLSAGCLAGDDAALAVLLSALFPRIRKRLVRRKLPFDVVDDTLAKLRERLLYPSDQRRPLLEGYAGRGALEGWLYRAAYREVMKAVVRRKEIPDEANVLAGLVAIDDPELSLLRELYGAEVRAAVIGALERLKPRERLLLRDAFVRGESPGAIAQRHEVHRITVSRWLTEIHDNVVASIEEAFAQRLKLSKNEVRRLALLVAGDLDVSLARILSDDDA